MQFFRNASLHTPSRPLEINLHTFPFHHFYLQLFGLFPAARKSQMKTSAKIFHFDLFHFRQNANGNDLGREFTILSNVNGQLVVSASGESTGSVNCTRVVT